MIDRLLGSRSVTLLAALFLVLVPTLFSVFTEWTQWGTPARVLVVVGWFVAAAVAALSTTRQSQQVDELIGEPLRRRDKERRAAAPRLIRALLAPGQTAFPPHYAFRLFLMDAEADRLLPAFEPEGVDAEAEGWAPGQGATGLAWEANNRVHVKGAAVSDATHGLSAVQQERYGDLAVVAAMPIRTARERRIGVLSVSSTTDDGFLDRPEATIEHLELAEVAARILVDILGVQE